MKRKLPNSHIFLAGIVSFLFFPLVTLAVATPTNFKGVIIIIVDILTAILPVIVSLAVIYFLWGITQYIKADEDKKEEAKTIMTNGIIALFIMASVWGIVWLLARTFIGTEGTTYYPATLDVIDPVWDSKWETNL